MKAKAILSTALALVLSTASFAQRTYTPTQANLDSREEFNDMRLGIFIHWGLYSMVGHGEWVMENEGIPFSEYKRLKDGFYPSKFNAQEWVDLFKSSGARYMTITSRHHDGFSMFDTKASDFNIMNTPFGRDVLKELADACHASDFRLHFYYSHLDWGRDDYYPLGRTGQRSGRNPVQSEDSWEHYQKFMQRQLLELVTNYGKIGAIWFDGIWDKEELAGSRENQPALWGLETQYDLIHSFQPGCLVANNHHLDPFYGEDIQTFERDVPGSNEAGYSGKSGVSTTVPLETCQTMNDTWGYNILDKNYKSVPQLVRLLARTAGKGANLLLNIGPRPDGTIPEEAVERLQGLGRWMETNGESIYGTDAGITGEQPWGVSTRKDNVLYLHILSDTDSIVIPSADGKHPVGAKVLSVTKLDGGSDVEFTVDRKTGNITIRPEGFSQDMGDMVVKVTFKSNI